MRIRTNQAGFSIVELLLVIVVVAAVAIVGIRMHNSSQLASSGTSQAVNKSPTATNVKSAPPINSTSDLDAAAATLNQTDPSTSNSVDTSQLDSQTSAL